MNKAAFENKSLVYITMIAYSMNLLFSLFGYLCQDHSSAQILLYQIGNAAAITAGVMAGRYTGLRGQQVAASGYVLMAITHGISLAALGRQSISAEKGMTMALPMIPALIFMFWCSLYPVWLRISGLIPICLFTLVYVNVQLGYSYFGWPLETGYGTLQVIEVLWAVYLLKDWKQNNP
jgi:hypothetical protein